jgi:hypothetical protein
LLFLVSEGGVSSLDAIKFNNKDERLAPTAPPYTGCSVISSSVVTDV